MAENTSMADMAIPPASVNSGVPRVILNVITDKPNTASKTIKGFTAFYAKISKKILRLVEHF